MFRPPTFLLSGYRLIKEGERAKQLSLPAPKEAGRESCVGKFFGIHDHVTFDDVKMLLWNKIRKDSWIVGEYIVIPDAVMTLFDGHKYVKLRDFDHLVCAYLNNHI